MTLRLFGKAESKVGFLIQGCQQVLSKYIRHEKNWIDFSKSLG